eukprot:Opistho-2@34198
MKDRYFATISDYVGQRVDSIVASAVASKKNVTVVAGGNTQSHTVACNGHSNAKPGAQKIIYMCDYCGEPIKNTSAWDVVQRRGYYVVGSTWRGFRHYCQTHNVWWLKVNRDHVLSHDKVWQHIKSSNMLIQKASKSYHKSQPMTPHVLCVD